MESVDVTYEGYLIEKKLREVLKKAFPESTGIVVKSQYRIGNQRCDFALTRDDRLLAVYEFDGPAHYQSSHTFGLDRKKDQLVRDAGAFMVRIPYFVQLKNDTLNHYLKVPGLTSTTEFPHGFISKKAPLPTSFTDEGLFYFCSQLETCLPRSVAWEVWNTMIDRGVDKSELVFWPKFAFIDNAVKTLGKEVGDYSDLEDVVKMK